MKLKAVLFDLDDTLYTNFSTGDAYGYERIGEYAEKTFGIDHAVFVRVMREKRKMFSRQQPGMPAIHDRVLVAQRTLESFGLNAIRHAPALHQIYWEAMFSKMTLEPSAAPLLKTLQQAGIKRVVCTDMMAYVQMQKIEYLGIADDIDYLVTSEEVGADKPRDIIFLLSLQKCHCLADEAIMIGDNFQHDVQGALDIGMGGIWLNRKKEPRPEEKRTYKEVHSFTEAAEYIYTLL